MGRNLKYLGEGASAKVYEYEEESGEVCTVKKSDLRLELCGEICVGNVSEAYVLKYLDHPNIIGIRDVEIKGRHINLYLPKADCDLSKLIADGGLDLDKIPELIYPLVEAMAYYFNMNVLHLDIKPSNILYFKGVGLKFADFGSSKPVYTSIYKRCLSSPAFSPMYTPINILLGEKRYDTMCDIWSFGCTIYEIYTGKCLFESENYCMLVDSIYKRLGKPNEDIWPGVTKLPKWEKYNRTPYIGTGFNEKIITERPLLLDLLNKIFDYRNFNKPYESDYISSILKHEYFYQQNNLGNVDYKQLSPCDKLLMNDKYTNRNTINELPSYSAEKKDRPTTRRVELATLPKGSRSNLDIGNLQRRSEEKYSLSNDEHMEIKIYLLKICDMMKLDISTLLMSYSLFDTFINKYENAINEDAYLSMGVACLQLASEINEEGVLTIKNCTVIYDKCSEYGICIIQSVIIKTLEYNIFIPTSYDMKNMMVSEFNSCENFVKINKTILVIISLTDIIYELRPSEISNISIELSYVYIGRFDLVKDIGKIQYIKFNSVLIEYINKIINNNSKSDMMSFDQDILQENIENYIKRHFK